MQLNNHYLLSRDIGLLIENRNVIWELQQGLSATVDDEWGTLIISLLTSAKGKTCIVGSCYLSNPGAEM